MHRTTTINYDADVIVPLFPLQVIVEVFSTPTNRYLSNHNTKGVVGKWPY